MDSGHLASLVSAFVLLLLLQLQFSTIDHTLWCTNHCLVETESVVFLGVCESQLLLVVARVKVVTMRSVANIDRMFKGIPISIELALQSVKPGYIVRCQLKV